MSGRRNEHDKFRDLFKPSKEQTTVGKSKARPRTSSNSPHGSQGASKSFRSVNKNSGGRAKPSGKKKSGGRKKASVNVVQSPVLKTPPPHGTSNNSNNRASKSPLLKTPPNPGSRARTPNKKVPTSGAKTPVKSPAMKFNGQEVHEKTQMCPTVFENDAGGGGAGPTIQLAEARIKERKLQWKKEGQPQCEPSGSRDSEAEQSMIEIKKEEIKEVVKTTRTLFENEDGHQAQVKDEKEKLQWAPSAERECMSEPEVRKKKSSPKAARALSERPVRETIDPLVMPLRQFGQARTPTKAGSPSVMSRSPSTRPVMLPPSETTSHSADDYTGGTGGFGTGTGSAEGDERPASCYIAPNMQHANFKKGTPVKKKDQAPDSEPYDYSPKKY